MTIVEILKTTRITQSKVYLSEEIKKKFNIKEDDKVLWCVNKEGELILKKSDIGKYYF